MPSEESSLYGYSSLDVEEAILEQLMPLKVSHGVKTIEGFQGELDEDGWNRLRRGFPAMLVSYGGSSGFSLSGRRLEENMEFSVYVMDKSRRTSATGQASEPGHPGTCALLREVRACLVGVQILPGLSACLPKAISGLTLDGASVFRMRLIIVQHITL